MKKINLFYASISMILLAIEILIALYSKDDFIRPILGDYLAVILLFYVLATFLKTSKAKIALIVLVLSYIIEALQYFNTLEVLHLEHFDLLRMVLGTTFSWIDLLAYTLGILTVIFIHHCKKN